LGEIDGRGVKKKREDTSKESKSAGCRIGLRRENEVKVE
jgi:hypothetical protein